ncbi:MAG: hypothetical protein RIC19_19045 [Phaeodactylibacter sp.]|uniref:hypothetical protein n=1 Tax=Phaeodactylibacter sp. TaxID=1940289 RepID=UPI0032EB7014
MELSTGNFLFSSIFYVMTAAYALSSFEFYAYRWSGPDLWFRQILENRIRTDENFQE